MQCVSKHAVCKTACVCISQVITCNIHKITCTTLYLPVLDWSVPNDFIVLLTNVRICHSFGVIIIYQTNSYFDEVYNISASWLCKLVHQCLRELDCLSMKAFTFILLSQNICLNSNKQEKSDKNVIKETHPTVIFLSVNYGNKHAAKTVL